MSISLPKPITVPPTAPDARNPSFPPLETGQQLSADEFMHRYEATPDLENVELIEGVVHVASPVSASFHGKPHSSLVAWMFHYVLRTPGTDTADNSTTILDGRNVPQPDCMIYLLAGHGGQSHINERGYVVGPPELVAEVSASTSSIDLNQKLTAYERNGIKEYIICRVHDAQVDWLVLTDGTYMPIPPQPDGTLHSQTFPGLWLDPAALLAGNRAALIETLDQGLASPEHAEFVNKLRLS